MGLTVDYLESMEVVTWDGDVLVISPENHADLFWGLSGGGSIGIVTITAITIVSSLPSPY